MSSTSVTYDIHGNAVSAPPTLPDGWESTWEELIGSPRFEEARQISGATLDDLRAPTGPINPNLEEAVVRALEERREKRRLYELRCVMEERQKKIDSSSESSTPSPRAPLWAARKRGSLQVVVQVRWSMK